MKKKVIGIVVEKIEGDIMTAALATSEVELQLDELSRLEIRNKITKQGFKLNMKEKVFSIYLGTMELAREIAKELRKIGFKDLKVLFNEKLYDV